MPRFILSFFILLFVIEGSFAQFRTKQIIGSNAVLQRNTPIPISGWGKPGEEVKVIFDRKEYPATADQTGYWTAILPATAAGGPYDLSIKSADNGILYANIYFGDVWLCSGQSNMEWPLKNTDNAEEVIRNANDDMIRHFKVPRANEDSPVSALPGGEWEVLSSETAGDFTAVGYYFAERIRQNHSIPIGLLNSSWGGSRLEPWISKQTLDQSQPEYAYAAYVEKNPSDVKDIEGQLRNKYPEIDEEDKGMNNGKPLWVDNREDLKWMTIDPTKKWEEQGYENLDGIIYYRTYFEASEGFTLRLGAIDDADMTWVNGELVGQTQGYNVERAYEVPKRILRSGSNELLIRIEDTGGGGGLYQSNFETMINGKPLTDFSWQMRPGAIRINKLNNRIPNRIFNAMIHPIVDFPIAGVIWYQGESNTRTVEEAYDYRQLLRTLIADWRNLWNQPELPFYFVQLANFREPQDQPEMDSWAMIRESMNDVLEVPMTGQAVIIDIGEAKDIHPRNKKDVGYRLALPALHQVYGDDVVPGSPMYANHEKVGNHMVIEFKQVGEGLEVRNRYGYINGFSIAGADGKYHWAQAKLEDGKVIVWSESVSDPVSVRYAWETNPFDVNLFSKHGLPVTPFRVGE